MSYILDALRRADEERREQEAATELHDQVVAPAATADGASLPAAWGPWIVAAVCVAIAGVVGAYAWQMQGGAADPGAARAAEASTPPTPTSTPMVSATTPAVAETPVGTATPSADSRPSTGDTHRARTPGKGERNNGATSPDMAAPNVTSSSATAPAPPNAAVADAQVPVSSLAALPDEIRRALPPMRFDGTIYSEVPASRLVLINGQLLREGEAFTTDVRVEEIRPRSAILSYRGRRFEFAPR
ncbi:general secretion pathway protein GspB [Niveibacterium sp. SC-1]|uniref:general secretion pathway protein GspB n=1 Tax=Niveibacterium sp. SC-1 TaxID=3135646 RepID=UPI00311D75A4